MSNIVGGLDILRQWRFSAVLEHQAAAVRMTLNPAWKVDFIDPEDVQLPLQQVADARRQVSSSVTTAAKKNSKNDDASTTANNDGSSRARLQQQQQQLLRDQMPKMFLVPFLAFTDESMAPRKGASDLLSGFSVGWAATIKRIKMFYGSLPPPLHQPAIVSAEDEADELELNRMKAWCKRCVQHVLEDSRVVSIDGNKKLRKLRTKTMLSPEQRITLGQHHHGFRFSIVYEQKGEMTPQSNAVALCVCSKDHGYMILVECVSKNELENYVLNVLIKTWLSDAKRFELGAEITGYSECSHAALQLQQALFGELVFTDNDAAIAFRIPMHPMTLRPDHSPTVPPASGSLCCVTLDLLLHQKLLDTLEEDEASAIGGKIRLVNVVLVVEVEDLLKEPNFPTVFSGDEYSSRRHERFTEVFKDSRVIGLPLSVPIGRRTGRSMTCTFSTVMNDTQALVKSTTVTTLVGSHGASATYFTKLGQGMFDQYLYLYQHLLKTLMFFAERDISGTFSRYRSVPIRILEADLAACYPHGSSDPSARLAALQKHITSLRAASDGEVEGMNMADIVWIDDSMLNEATGTASAKMVSGATLAQQAANNKKDNGGVTSGGVAAVGSSSEFIPDDTTIAADGDRKNQKHQKQQPQNVDDDQETGGVYYQQQDGLQLMGSRRFTDIDSVISVSDIPRLTSEEIAMLEEEDATVSSGTAAGGRRVSGEGGADNENVLSGSPNAAIRSKSPQPGVSIGDTHDHENANNDGNNNNNKNAFETTSEMMNLNVNNNNMLRGETPGGDSRLSSHHNNQQQQGTSNQVTSHTGAGGSVGAADDRSARSTLGFNDDTMDDHKSVSRAATAGLSQQQQQKVSIVEPLDDLENTNNNNNNQRGKPTQQQLQDLAEALELIGDGTTNKSKSRLEEDIDAVLDATQQSLLQKNGGDGTDSVAMKNSTDEKNSSSSSSLRNSYIELCKDEDCRPNSYLLQKLPVIPRIAQTIEALDMSHNYVGHNGFVAILRLLDLLPRVHSVYFNSMSLDNQDVGALCDTLAEHTTIHSVFLKNNPRITLPAAKSFFRLLKDNINIHTISLTGTGIGLALQQRIEKDAQTNKEVQAENEKRRKQEQQQLRDNAAAASASPSSSSMLPQQQQSFTLGGGMSLTVANNNNNTNSTSHSETGSQKSDPRNNEAQQQQQQGSDDGHKNDENEAGSSVGSKSVTSTEKNVISTNNNAQNTSSGSAGTPLQKEGTTTTVSSSVGNKGSPDRQVVG